MMHAPSSQNSMNTRQVLTALHCHHAFPHQLLSHCMKTLLNLHALFAARCHVLWMSTHIVERHFTYGLKITSMRRLSLTMKISICLLPLRKIRSLKISKLSGLHQVGHLCNHMQLKFLSKLLLLEFLLEVVSMLSIRQMLGLKWWIGRQVLRSWVNLLPCSLLSIA